MSRARQVENNAAKHPLQNRYHAEQEKAERELIKVRPDLEPIIRILRAGVSRRQELRPQDKPMNVMSFFSYICGTSEGRTWLRKQIVGHNLKVTIPELEARTDE